MDSMYFRKASALASGSTHSSFLSYSLQTRRLRWTRCSSLLASFLAKQEPKQSPPQRLQFQLAVFLLLLAELPPLAWRHQNRLPSRLPTSEHSSCHEYHWRHLSIRTQSCMSACVCCAYCFLRTPARELPVMDQPTSAILRAELSRTPAVARIFLSKHGVVEEIAALLGLPSSEPAGAASTARFSMTHDIDRSSLVPSVQAALALSQTSGQRQAGPVSSGVSRLPPLSKPMSTGAASILPTPPAAASSASLLPKLQFPTSLPKAAGPLKRQLPDQPAGIAAPLKKPSGGALMNLPMSRRGFQPPAPSSTFKVITQWSHRQVCWPEQETLASLSSQGVGSAAPRSCKIPGASHPRTCPRMQLT